MGGLVGGMHAASVFGARLIQEGHLTTKLLMDFNRRTRVSQEIDDIHKFITTPIAFHDSILQRRDEPDSQVIYFKDHRTLYEYDLNKTKDCTRSLSSQSKLMFGSS